MKTMLNKVVAVGNMTVAHDITGIETLGVIIAGLSSGTACKVVTCDTADGVYTDFAELVPSTLASTSYNSGFVLPLTGAKKFVKVTGASLAVGFVGDCSYDINKAVYNAVEIPSGADKEEQTKSVTITENGTTTVSPDSGKVLSSVSITANVQTPKSDKYFLWGYSSSLSSWTTIENSWTSMCSIAGATSLTAQSGTAFPVFLYIKGKDATSDFTLNEQITIYSSQDASNSATVTVNHIDLNYLVVTNPKTGATGNIYLSRTKTAEISTFLTTFARFDGITKLPTFEAINVIENAVVLPPNTADGIGYAFVNVPPVVTEPSKIITETFTPELNTPHVFSTSAGPGGSYGLSDSGAFNKLIKASDISGGTITTARITWGPGASQGYYVDFSLAVSGSGYPQTLTITPTAIGSAWGTRTASVCLVL